MEAWALGDCGLRAAAIAAWVRVVRYVACDTLGGWAARLWPMGLCPLLPAVCAWRLCGRSRWAESVVLIRSGKREFPAGIIPDENGNRKYGRENIPTEFVPVPAHFPVFFPFSCFHYGNGTRSVSTGNGAGRDGIFPSRFQPYMHVILGSQFVHACSDPSHFLGNSIQIE